MAVDQVMASVRTQNDGKPMFVQVVDRTMAVFLAPKLAFDVTSRIPTVTCVGVRSLIGTVLAFWTKSLMVRFAVLGADWVAARSWSPNSAKRVLVCL